MDTVLSDFMYLVPGISLVKYDMSGNMIAVIDDTGVVAAKFLYTPFGEVITFVIISILYL
jgi:hypothetical protein